MQEVAFDADVYQREAYRNGLLVVLLKLQVFLAHDALSIFKGVHSSSYGLIILREYFSLVIDNQLKLEALD